MPCGRVRERRASPLDLIWDKFTEWLKELLVGGIMDNLTGLFDNVNAKVAEAAGHIGSTPQAWNSNIYNMIRSLSDNVILPIAGVILAFVMTLELIQLITDKNNLHDLDTWIFFKWVFKTAAAVLIVTNTWNIVMGVFEAAQSVIGSASGVIVGDTSINLADHIVDLEARLMEMNVWSLLGLSMTLETLTSVVFQGIIYEDEIILSRNDYLQIQEMKEKGNIADFIKKRRSVYKRIWEDLFVPYVDDPAAFKAAVHNFIEDRNHIAHSKVLSWNAYQITLGDFSAITNLITSANTKFEQDETSDEVALTLEIEMEESQYDNEDYLRDRLSSETGIDILDEEEIKDWFDEVFHELYNSVYQQYHLDVCYDISDLSSNIGDLGFTISSPAVEDGSAKLKIIAEYSIDDDLGSDSTCEICVKRERGDEVCKAQIRFHNGDGYENEEGLMEAADSSEYDTVELDDLKEELFAAIESLNPYPEQLSTLVLENKGAVQFVGDCPCEQCGKCGVSINPDFLPIGKCCYCGFENEMVVCERCGELVNAVIAEQGFCPSCAACIEQQ